MGAFKLLHGRATGGGVSGINFGTKTRQGFGGYPVSETTGATFSGTHGAKFTVDDVNQLVPAGTYGGLWTSPPVGGPYTITSNGTGTVYTITIINGMHAREKTVAPTNQDFKPGTGFGVAFNQIVFYTGDIANGVSICAQTALGDTIWCRDGRFNPSAADQGARFPDTSSYTGTGRITIRSETVDTSVDACGWPNRQHGFKIGRWTHSGAGTGGIPACPITYQDIEFYNDNLSIGFTGILAFNNGNPCDGVQVQNCGFRQPDAWTDAQIEIAGMGVGNVSYSGVINSCSFRNTSGGIQVADNTTNAVITSNFFKHIRENDIIQLGHSSSNVTITDNFAFDAVTVSGNHVDGTQHVGMTDGTSNKAFGTFARNIWVNADVQGLFVADNVAPNGFASATVQNNITLGLESNSLALSAVSNSVFKWNTALVPMAGPFDGAIRNGAAANTTYTRNVGNSMDQAWGSATTGTITNTPNPNVTVARTLVAYQAVFPNYVDPATLTDWSLAAAKALVTPSTAAFNGVLAQSGALTDAGAWNATP